MEKNVYTYKTLTKPSEVILLKDKKSKFYGYAFPIQGEAEVKSILEGLRKKHHTANHVCYAWQLGEEKPMYRANDDGEPNNSAGMPIYGQIQSFEVTNVLVAVARIFGGTKLGVGGLIHAYRTTSKMALEVSDIEERTLKEEISLSFQYAEMDKVMRIVKQYQLEILSQKLELDCEILFAVKRQDAIEVLEIFEAMQKVTTVKRD